jgi:uncharacterized membrane protein YeaQ/YmgE (transglycosylase-associated protein family)
LEQYSLLRDQNVYGELMQFFWFGAIGALVGWLSYLQLDGGKTRLASDILAGLCGAMVCGMIASGLQIPVTIAGTSATALVLSTFGAMIGVFVERIVRSKRRT